MCNITFAHSGRTDSDGGHRDNKNKRGLGNYYYHCGGHPAHLHTNGVRPYSNHSAHNPKAITSSLTMKTKRKADLNLLPIRAARRLLSSFSYILYIFIVYGFYFY